jgi:formylglycine-generating enzyme required for sulfatase activity
MQRTLINHAASPSEFSKKEKHPVRHVTPALAAIVLVWNVGHSAPEKFDPFPRKEEILKLFVDEFILVTPGKDKYPATFMMGSKKSPAEGPVHEVALKKPFAMAKNEVTQELYQVVMGNNPARWKGPRNSMEVCTWHEANAFCAKVTEELRKRKLIAADEIIRLPSEAEWEYCCRAGTTTDYSFGDDVKDLTHYGWYKVNAPGNDPPVGMKKANPWGFFDMHGYNWEWMADDWSPSYEGAPADGSARVVKDEKDKVIRSGSWADTADTTRSAYRGHHRADGVSDAIGFRCVKAKK